MSQYLGREQENDLNFSEATAQNFFAIQAELKNWIQAFLPPTAMGTDTKSNIYTRGELNVFPQILPSLFMSSWFAPEGHFEEWWKGTWKRREGTLTVFEGTELLRQLSFYIAELTDEEYKKLQRQNDAKIREFDNSYYFHLNGPRGQNDKRIHLSRTDYLNALKALGTENAQLTLQYMKAHAEAYILQLITAMKAEMKNPDQRIQTVEIANHTDVLKRDFISIGSGK